MRCNLCSWLTFVLRVLMPIAAAVKWGAQWDMICEVIRACFGLVGVTFFFRRILHCSKEVEGWKEKSDHGSLGCVRRLCGRISDDVWRYLYALILTKEARMRVSKGNEIGRSP